jgi:acetyl-CoA C-acetyltransferase
VNQESNALRRGAGTISLDGPSPVDFGGRLKVKVHPPGAVGVTQCVELFRQLREKAVLLMAGARIVLAHNIGGPIPRPTVSFLEGPKANGA